MSRHSRRGNAEVLAAIAAITGQTIPDVDAAFHEAKSEAPDKHRVTPEQAQALIDRVKTRLGLAPAVDAAQASDLSAALQTLIGDASVTITRSDVTAWDHMLRHTPESVPTLNRAPVVLPLLPAHQTEMWNALLAFEELQQPWVLVGGQMTMLHRLENGLTQLRPTDDGDVVVGVWTRRDALANASRFLRSRGFEELRTHDGYGYRFVRGEKPNVSAIDVLLPEGLQRQHSFPTTTSGRRGLTADGGNQALTRAERVPVTVEGVTGYVRRPNLLGSIVAKANAYVVDSRDVGRHAIDVVALAEIALRNPMDTLRQVRPGDRRPVRRFLRDKTPTHPYFRDASNPEAVFAFLTRLASSPRPRPPRIDP